MINSITKWITNNIKTNMEYDEIYFAVKVILFTILHFGTIVLVSLIFHQLLNGIIFSFLYIILRSYAGGFHMNTSKKCYLFSLLIFTLVIVVMKGNYIFLYKEIYLYIAFPIAFIIIFFLSPVDNKNKRLDNAEKSMFKKITRIILLIYGLVFALMCYFEFISIASIIVITIILESILLLIGTISNSLA